MGGYLVKRHEEAFWAMRMFYILIEMSVIQVQTFFKTSYYTLGIVHFTKYKSNLKMTPHRFV